jgi:two-component system alkaline phosphatase synthesis response regulator PhoP
MNEPKKILLVDDEPDIIEFLKYSLEKHDYEVIEAYSGWEAIAKMRYKPDLIVLDVMMPEMDGFEVFEKMRELEGENIPILFLTAKTSEVDEVKALDLGAVDYIYKPISPQKLIARINAIINLLKRKVESAPHKDVTLAGPLEIDADSYTVTISGEEKFFPKKEFQLLKLLADNPGKVFTRENLMNAVWGEMHYGVLRTVDVHISKVRERLGEYSDLIATVKGIGYKFTHE